MATSSFDSHRVIISRGFWSVIALKPVSALIGIVYLLLLIRGLDKSEYAIYVAGWAIIEIVTLLTNAGTLTAAYRYIYRLSDSNAAPAGPVTAILLIRVITLAAGVFVLYFLLLQSQSNEITGRLYEIFTILALIIMAEGTARLLDVMLESSLYQARAQFSQIFRITFKLVPAYYFYTIGELSIENVFVAELIGVLSGLGVASILLCSTFLNSDFTRKSKNHDGATPRATMLRYSFVAFLASAASIVYSVDSFKIILSTYSDPELLAAFGFAYAVVGFLQRYMPANILGGFIRPLYVIASKGDNSSASLNNINNLFIKINMLVTLIFMAIFFGSGDFIVTLISDQYIDTVIIIQVLIVAIFVSSIRLPLANFCLARELAKPALISEMSCWTGLVLVVPMALFAGALGVAITILVNELVWILVCISLLSRSTKANLALNWSGIFKMIVIMLTMAFLSRILGLSGWAGIAYSGLALLILPLSVWHLSIISKTEWRLLKSIVGVKAGR